MSNVVSDLMYFGQHHQHFQKWISWFLVGLNELYIFPPSGELRIPLLIEQSVRQQDALMNIISTH